MRQKQRRHTHGVPSTLSVSRPDWCEDSVSAKLPLVFHPNISRYRRWCYFGRITFEEKTHSKAARWKCSMSALLIARDPKIKTSGILSTDTLLSIALVYREIYSGVKWFFLPRWNGGNGKQWKLANMFKKRDCTQASGRMTAWWYCWKSPEAAVLVSNTVTKREELYRHS